MSDYKSKSKKSSGRNSKRRPNKKEFEKESKEFSKVKESANDPDWYYYSEQSLKDAGRLSFNNALGVALPVTTGYFLEVPGIMNIYTTPAIGYSDTGTSAVNIAAKNLYSYVRHANSGHSNYDSPDLMMYILAMDSLYSMYAWMTRIYGLAKIYVQQNRYWGAQMLRSMGLIADDFASNLANFRTYINQFAVKLSAFYVPASMSLFKRHTWMYANVFADEDDVKAGVYMYQPGFLWQYDEVNGILEAVGVTCTASTSAVGHYVQNINNMSYVINLADTMLSKIVASESMNIMSGDILKAYGAENCWKFGAIDDDYTILPMFSEEVLLQIHNTKFVGRYPVVAAGDPGANKAALNVYQDTTPGFGRILYTPCFANARHLSCNQVFDSWKQEVPPEDVMVGSRNMVSGVTSTLQMSDSSYKSFAFPTACGSELCLFATTWVLDVNGNFTSQTLYDTSVFDTTLAQITPKLNAIMRFNEAPLTTNYAHVTTSTGIDDIRPERLFGELSNYTMLDNSDLRKLHDTALLSEFAVPFLGNLVK